MNAVIFLFSLIWLFFGVSPAHAQVERIQFMGGPPTGMFGILVTGISTYLSKTVPGLDVSHVAGEGAVANIRRVNAGEAEMGLSFASDLHEAFYGLEKFKDKPATNLRAIGQVVVGVAHLVTHADSGIRTVGDLVGKRVAVGSPGTGTFATAERLFRSLGIWDRINRVPLLGTAAGEALSEGRADAYFWNGARPDRVTMEAATKRPVHVIDIYAAASKTDFFKQYPYFTRYIIPAGAYSGVTQDVTTFGISFIWIAHRDLSAPLLQKIVAAAYGPEGQAHMLRVHKAAADMTPKKALSGITIPLHKGAEAHWKSVGLQIPETIRAR